MATQEPGAGFWIWGVDNQPYGPIELPGLVQWVKEERVTATTWVYHESERSWLKAETVPELQMFFGARSRGLQVSGDTQGAVTELPLSTLRRVRVLAELTDTQLERFLDFVEVQAVRQWNTVVKQGESGDAMYMILVGELRARLVIDAKESTLATLAPGDFFGEISLFDEGPRSADVVANVSSVLLKLSSVAFGQLVEKAPDIAAPILLAMAKTLTTRIRADNRRYRDSIQFLRIADQQLAASS